VTAQTYRRFRERNSNFEDDVPVDLFRGLCAYLLALIHWGWDIEGEDFDDFIYCYPAFEELPGRTSTTEEVSYHQWFMIHGRQPQPRTDVTTLDSQVLEAIRQENPYTFALAEASLNAIVKARNARSTRTDMRGAVTQPAGCPKVQTTSITSQRQHTANHFINGSVSATQFQHLEPLQPEKQWHSEKELRDRLGVRDRQELMAWMRQDWVLEVYDEYCMVELDRRRCKEQSFLDNGQTVPPGAKRSTARFLINASAIALQSGSTKYTREEVDKSNWTGDDHDIRFIARLVQIGRHPGHWWENFCHDGHIPELCTVGYRLLSWLRSVHRLSTARSQSSQVQRAVASQCHSQLSQVRASRASHRSP
jgi:hypothetical protein